MGWEDSLSKQNSNARGQVYEYQIQMCILNCNHRSYNLQFTKHLWFGK